MLICATKLMILISQMKLWRKAITELLQPWLISDLGIMAAQYVPDVCLHFNHTYKKVFDQIEGVSVTDEADGTRTYITYEKGVKHGPFMCVHSGGEWIRRGHFLYNRFHGSYDTKFGATWLSRTYDNGEILLAGS